MGIHFLISQIVGYAGLLILMRLNGGGLSLYYENVILLTGISGILTIFPCLYFYRRDAYGRRICGSAGGFTRGKAAPGGKSRGDGVSPAETLLLLIMGAAFSQYVNLFVALFQDYLNVEEYQESMSLMTDGKSLWFLILCMGILAPVAEEIVFRWLIYLRLRDYLGFWPAAVLSGMIFGIYHGNLVQAFYAGILGIIFAYFMELTGSLKSSILLHMGANIWSLVWSDLAGRILNTEEAALRYGTAILIVLAALFAAMAAGTVHFLRKKQEDRAE